jgi:AcrR family transcriptional regulator
MAERNAERTKAAEHTRDAERTKEAILVAAEHRFARLGFHGTSLQQIGEAAGVARSTPAYFFRSKEALYDSVLARAVARAQGAMARAYAEQDAGRSAEEAVESYVGAFLDEALAALEPAAKKAGIPPQRLVLDLAALCWYPFAHEHTLLPALGMKARDPTFLAEQKRHLGDLVRAMTRAERQRRSRRQRS